MAEKRIKKPAISPEKRAEWLKRYEQYGETPPKIADTDDADVRTVRKHLELAQRERDAREARTTLFREALRDHYQDMLVLVEEIESSVSKEYAVALDGSVDLRLEALRQHIPRSYVWNNIRKFNNALITIDEIRDHSRSKIQTEVGNEVQRLSIGSTEMIKGLADVLMHQLEQWVRRNQGFNLSENFIIESKKKTEVLVRYGFSHLGWVKKKDLERLKKMIEDFEAWIRNIEEFNPLEVKFNSLKSIRSRIQKEFDGIRMRKILPGKCKYCPL